MPHTETKPAPAWITGPAAAALLGVASAHTIERLAARRMIGVLKIPGAHPRYKRDDVLKLLERSVQEAEQANTQASNQE